MTGDDSGEGERVARLETRVSSIEETQAEQSEKLDEILKSVHRLHDLDRLREQHREMWQSHQTADSYTDTAWRVLQVVSGGGVVALVLDSFI